MRVNIVGSGPSGCSTAISLLSRRRDAEVTLYDREAYGRIERCGGGISDYMLPLTGVGEVPRRLVMSPIRRVRIHAGGCFWEMDCGSSGLERYGVVLDRASFDRWLMGKAERLGATILEERVSDPSRLEGDFLVGADGVNSVVRKRLGLPDPNPSDLHFCVQTKVEWGGYPDGEINLYFGDVAPKGYAWTFPSGGLVKVGLGVPLSLRLNPARLLKRFMDAQRIPEGGGIIAKLIPTSRPMESCVFGKTALVGDAALFCDPCTGGGIANALIGGLLLGEALSRGDLQWYEKMWRRSIGRRNSRRYMIKKILSGLGEEEYREIVKALQGFNPRSMVIEREVTQLLNRVFPRSPRLIGKILKALVSTS
jgi:flavin-dependent dehydrogenase